MNRYRQLDSLRGLAALSVLVFHFLLILPEFYNDTSAENNIINLIKYSPLRFFFAGHAAVILFFVLSGFVLSIPMLENRGILYSHYLIKRILRIYTPYLATVMISFIAAKNFYSGNILELSDWFNRTFHSNLNALQIFQHLLLMPNFDNAKLNPVLWSLVQEMRISIIFPFVVIFISKYKWKFILMISLIFSFLGLMSFAAMNLSYHLPNDYVITLHYLALFMIGGLLAKHRSELIQYLRSFSVSIKIILLFGAILAYTSPYWLFTSFKTIHYFADDWMIAGGVSLFITLAISSNRVAKTLTLKPLLFMGDISYSLYLYHSVALFSVTHLFYGRINLFIIWSLSLVISIIIAALSYYLIEKPSIKLGHELTLRLRSAIKHREISNEDAPANLNTV